MSNIQQPLSHASNKLLQALEKNLDSYNQTRLKLYDYTEKHGNSFFDNPANATAVSLSGFALIGGIASIPLGGAPAFLLGGFALGAAGMFGTTAHYLLNKIANPIMKHVVIKKFDANEEVEKYIKVMDRCLQVNNKMMPGDKADLVRELSRSLLQKTEASFKKDGKFEPYLDQKSIDDLADLKSKLNKTAIAYVDNEFKPLSKNGDQVSQQSLMSKWISKMSGSKESSAEVEPNRPGMRK